MDKNHFDKVGKGSITISRVSCNRGTPDYMSIRVQDDLSSCTFLEIEMDLQSFAEAITGLSSQPIQFGIRSINRVGKKLEVKSENVSLPDWPNDENVEEAVSALEVDGWIGSRRDCKNHHNRVGRKDNTYGVSFHRWVDIEETEKDEEQKG